MESNPTVGETKRLKKMIKNDDALKRFEPTFLLAAGVMLVVQLVSAPMVTADPGDAATTAERERQQREFEVAQAREAYYQGLDLEENGQIAEAGGHYRLALDTLPLAERTDPEREVYADAFARVCIKLAEDSAAEGGLDAAKRFMEVASEYAPDHRGVQELKKRLNDPDWYAPGDNQKHRERVARVRANLGQGEAALDLGELNAAQESFYEVLREDPYNTAARQGLERVDRARSHHADASYDHTRAALLDDVLAKWKTSVPERRRLGGGPAGDDFSLSGDLGRTFDGNWTPSSFPRSA